MSNPAICPELEELRKATIKYALKCDWCKGFRQENDGENYINAPCPHCIEIWVAIDKIKFASYEIE